MEERGLPSGLAELRSRGAALAPLKAGLAGAFKGELVQSRNTARVPVRPSARRRHLGYRARTHPGTRSARRVEAARVCARAEKQMEDLCLLRLNSLLNEAAVVSVSLGSAFL